MWHDIYSRMIWTPILLGPLVGFRALERAGPKYAHQIVVIISTCMIFVLIFFHLQSYPFQAFYLFFQTKCLCGLPQSFLFFYVFYELS